MMREPTHFQVPADHPAYAAGFTQGHLVVFQPPGDAGGLCNSVCIQIPETPGHLVAQAIAHAVAASARIVFICDTAGQADDAVNVVDAIAPDHVRVSIERALSAGWSLT